MIRSWLWSNKKAPQKYILLRGWLLWWLLCNAEYPAAPSESLDKRCEADTAAVEARLIHRFPAFPAVGLLQP